MEHNEIIIVVALFLAVIILITIKITNFLLGFRRDTGHTTSEISCDGLLYSLAPSVISIFMCALCLCGTSWAWFTSTQTSSVANIQTATYSVSVAATAKKGDSPVVKPGDNGAWTITLGSDNEYTIKLTASGTAKSGYCKIELGETTYFTPQIAPNNDFTYTVKAYGGGELTITPQWGTCSATDNIVNAGTTIEFGTKPKTNSEKTNSDQSNKDETDHDATTAEPSTTQRTEESTADHKNETADDGKVEETTTLPEETDTSSDETETSSSETENSSSETETSKELDVTESELDTEPEDAEETDVTIE